MKDFVQQSPISNSVWFWGREGVIYLIFGFFSLITLEAGMCSKASESYVSALQSESHFYSAIWRNDVKADRMSREVTIVPGLISHVIWQVGAYYAAFLLIGFQGLKRFLEMQRSGNGHPH